MGRFGVRTVRTEETGSTNDDARALAIDGAAEGTVVRADRQTAGRGRLGRAWASPAGGLWFSVVLRPTASPARWPLLPLLAGSSVAAALRGFGVDAAVKWPNDVLVRGRKVAGVLVESRFAGDASFAVVGIGVNAGVDEAALPPDVRALAAAVPVTADAAFAAILRELEARCDRFEAGRFPELLDECRRLSCTLGRPVDVAGVRGVARDLRAEDAALVVETDAAEWRAVVAGDVGP